MKAAVDFLLDLVVLWCVTFAVLAFPVAGALLVAFAVGFDVLDIAKFALVVVVFLSGVLAARGTVDMHR